MEAINKKETYAIVDIQDQYLSLIVTFYQNSQFYILFNERIYHNHNQGSKSFSKIFKQGKIFNNLIKQAEKELKISLKNISYNLPIKNIKIIPHEYFYKFSEPTLFNERILNNINEEFLKSYQRKKQYQNFLFKINKYILLDQKESFSKPPFQRILSSIKISGFLYQAEWKQIYKYSEIFKITKKQPFRPILLPYAIYINILFSERTKKTVLVMWNEDKIQVFIFEKKIFTHVFEIKKELNLLLNQIINKLNVDKEDIKKYLYNQFIIEEKLILNTKDTTIFVFGDVTKISGFNDYIQTIQKKWKWKVQINHFTGLKSSEDAYLIGNAYYHHLQNKLSLIKQSK